MKTLIYIVIIDNIPAKQSFTSLRAACSYSKVSYWTVLKQFKSGSFERKGIGIYETELTKIKGRGRKL